MQLLGVSDAARMLNLSVNTLYAWVHQRKIPHVKLGGKLAFEKIGLQNFIIAHTIQPCQF